VSDELELAAKEPWWAKAPAYLAVAIVGVPSAIALAAGWFIANNVTYRLKLLETYDLSILSTLSQMSTKSNQDIDSLEGFMRATLRAAQQNCLNNAKTVEQQHKCVQVPDP